MFQYFIKANYAEILKTIREKKTIDADTEIALKKAISEFKETFAAYDNNQLLATR